MTQVLEIPLKVRFNNLLIFSDSNECFYWFSKRPEKTTSKHISKLHIRILKLEWSSFIIKSKNKIKSKQVYSSNHKVIPWMPTINLSFLKHFFLEIQICWNIFYLKLWCDCFTHVFVGCLTKTIKKIDSKSQNYFNAKKSTKRQTTKKMYRFTDRMRKKKERKE